jgi:hypothetical protein
VIKGDSKKVGNDIVTVVKVKNMSSGAIALLRADESWYDKKTRQVVTGDTYRHMKPLLPGEIVEMTLRSPFKPDLYASRIDFSHANGKIEAKAVKKFE